MRRPLAAVQVLLLLAPAAVLGQSPAPPKVIDLRAARPPVGNSFEALWSAYRKAERKGDLETAKNALKEIRRLRTERNVRSLEVLGLARVAEGLRRLREGEREKAVEAFQAAISLDPHLPDAYFGMARADVKSLPLGIVPAVRHTLAATTAPLGTTRGKERMRALLVPVTLLALFATAAVFALAMLLRHGMLLLHDLEESFGPGRTPLALAVYAVLLLLPAITFQGFGWLPLWWLALLFIYLGLTERIVTGALVLAAVAVGPLVHGMEAKILAQQNPTYRAALLAVEGGPDSRAIAELEEAFRKYPDDRDLVFLLAAQYKKAGRYDDAANFYRDVLRAEPNHAAGLNNMASLEFSGGEFKAAIARYKQALETGPPAPVAATLYYNLSLAHLQLFEFQPATEARSQADRLDSSLVRTYDSLWKYEDKNEYAVVDLNLAGEEAASKFVGLRQGLRAKNVLGKGPAAPAPQDLWSALANRFTAVPVVFALAFLGMRRWRGAKMFTMSCVKCGTPFCHRCHLGTIAGGLCTQCHHLFIVRDGVSGPARNQKLLEVQKEDERRERIFRGLSLLFPGAGHLYARKTLVGMVFVFLWSAVLAAAFLAGRVLPLSEASSDLSTPWGLWVAAALVLAIYVAANRSRPDFEVLLPTRRASTTTGTLRRRAS